MNVACLPGWNGGFFLSRQSCWRGGGRGSALVSPVGRPEMAEKFLETDEAVGFLVSGVRLVAPVLELL